MSDLKRNEVLSFDDGLLTVKMSGHGDANGWGELAFHERQSEIDADGFHHFELPPSELRALRDFLNRVTPNRASAAVLAATREHVASPPLVDPQPYQMSDRALLMECLHILHSFALEQTGWRGFFRRWHHSDEPLRHDAANLVRRAEFMAKQPECTRLVGEGR